MTHKAVMDFTLEHNVALSPQCSLLKLTPQGGTLPDIAPGQFVQVEVPNSKTTYLRRPISVNYVQDQELWLLVRRAGAGTAALCDTPQGARLNLVLPLGHGFTTKLDDDCGSILLVGGGVGVAPLLQLGKVLGEQGRPVHFLLGARTAADVLELDMFKAIGRVDVATEDGSMGEHGFVTQHSVLSQTVGHIACCGPLPMMKAVAAIARQRGIDCEVSLENMMACGLGACLCCVEDTRDEGNVCVCKEGPVFNINRLKW